MLNYSFLRQRPVDIFIADFLCKDLLLIVEVDGLIHSLESIREHDKEREKRLRDLGFTIVRVTNDEVQFDIEEVRLRIERTIREIEIRDKDRLAQLKIGRTELLNRHSKSRRRRETNE